VLRFDAVFGAFKTYLLLQRTSICQFYWECQLREPPCTLLVGAAATIVCSNGFNMCRVGQSHAQAVKHAAGPGAQHHSIAINYMVGVLWLHR